MDESVPVPAATGNGNEVVTDAPSCHLCFEILYRTDDSPAASLPYKVQVGGGVFEGETDGSGRLRVDLVPADDYLLEIGDVRMHVTAFPRTEEARTLHLVADADEGSAG
jgi:hypothetical protein